MDAMVISPGQQRGAGRRTQRRGVESVVAQTSPGNTVQGGGRDRAAKSGGRPEPDVVEEDDDDVGSNLAERQANSIICWGVNAAPIDSAVGVAPR